MIKKKLTNFEYGTLSFFMTRAFLIRGTFDCLINALRQDSWIAPILSIIPAIAYILIINYISKYKENLTIAEKLKTLFSKKISILLISIISLFALTLAILNLFNISIFIQSQFLSKTPVYAIAITFAIVAIYVLSKGIKTITRTSVILFYLSIILYIIIFIGLIPNLNLENLKPILNSKPTEYLTAINSFFAYNTIVIFPLLSIPNNNIEKPKIKKTLMLSYVLSALTILGIIFTTITIFGYELAELFEYPIFHTLKYISIIGVTSRVESILVMQLLFDIFMSLVIVTYFIADNTSSILNIKNKNILYYILFIISIIGAILLSFKTTLLDEVVLKILPIITTIFTLTLITVICIKIKKEKKHV